MGLAQPKQQLLYTAEEYLELERAADERHDYWDGEIFTLSGESTNHGIISVNLVVELGMKLKKSGCRAFTKDMKTRSGSDIDLHKSLKGFFSYPDILIVCGEMRFHDKQKDVILNPQVIIEVLSPSTELFDRGKKFVRYRENLPTLTDYVLVAQDYPTVDHFRRGAANGQWILQPADGLDAIWNLPDLGVSIPLTEIYDGVEFPPEDFETEVGA